MQHVSLYARRRKPQRAIIAAWRVTDAEISAAKRHVTIDHDRIPDVLRWIAPGTPSTAWRSYVSPVNDVAPDLGRLYYELALTISQFGGFVGYRPDGTLDTWKLDGSGVKAILATMAAIRQNGKLPGIDDVGDPKRDLAHHFIGTPFGNQRLEMLIEVGARNGRAWFDNHLALAMRADGSYCFNILHMVGLAHMFPLSFGQDPQFYKKASLLLLTMEIALNQLGHRATAMTLPPADYRIPQILEGMRILRFNDQLSARISEGHVFHLNDPEVRAIRTMTVEAVGHIKTGYERERGKPISCAELDGMLYLLSRNRPFMARTTMKPHMLVATATF